MAKHTSGSTYGSTSCAAQYPWSARMKPLVAMSWSRHARTIFSLAPFFCARRALCSMWAAGPKRYLKKSNSVGRSGMRGRRGSCPMRYSLPRSSGVGSGSRGSRSPDV